MKNIKMCLKPKSFCLPCVGVIYIAANMKIKEL
jgi:hypothetical protein